MTNINHIAAQQVDEQKEHQEAGQAAQPAAAQQPPRQRSMTTQSAKMYFGRHWRLKVRIQGVQLSRSF